MSNDYGFQEEEFTSKFNGGTVLRILAQVRPHWRWVAGFMACIILVAVIEAYFNLITMRIIDQGILAGRPDVVRDLLIQYALIWVVFCALIFSFIYLTGVLGHRVQYDMRKKMFEHLQALSFSYFDKTPVGWVMSRMTGDATRIAELVTWGILDSTWAIVNVLTAAVFMLTINWQLALIVIALLPVLLGVALWFKARILAQYRITRSTNSKITGTMNENIVGVRVVKAMSREEANLTEFSELTDRMYKSSFKAAWLSALFLPAVQMISALAVGAIVWYSGVNINNEALIGGLTIGGLSAFISYIRQMLWPVQDMARVYAEMQQSIASAERVFSLMDAVPDLVDQPGATDPGTLKGDIEFDNVTFYYTEDKPVLTNFNLKVRQGETIALVGPTGHGKSTIVNLVCRFYEPKDGVVRIGGQDYTTMPMHAIHSRIGMVLQTPHLFSGTISENIRYGRLDATDDEIIEAARLAGAHEFIMTLEKGYEEQVGEGGVLLSTGQKQLISLARAVLADPEIFIMDEATSSVDTLTEALIQQGMDSIMEDRTSFVIAHRLSTIRKADRIIVIEHGQIAEMGSHAELIRKRGHYYNLYTQQFRQELEEKYNKTLDEVESIPA
ncbi:MAG: ABC transporter ATP-binding protein [bacterium]|nr:ABC transporter ATP-binding protein [bacterium]